MPVGTPPGSPTPVVDVKPIDYTHPHSPSIKTYHGLSIVVDGRIVGRIQSWQPKMYARGGTHVWELSHLTFGRPVDYVPGKGDGYSITANRAEMWNDEFELAVGFPTVWSDLLDQDHPFSINEHLLRGNTIYRSWSYHGCWFGNRVEANFEAESDSPKVMADAEIFFVSRIRTT